MTYCVDEAAYFRNSLHVAGWGFRAGRKVMRITLQLTGTSRELEITSIGEASEDVARVHGTAAQNCRFHAALVVGEADVGKDFCLNFHFVGGTTEKCGPVLAAGPLRSAALDLEASFFSQLAAPAYKRVLEIGSRARSAISRRDKLPASATYVGLDIMQGPNVDVVGDAHDLKANFAGASFDAVFSLSVFEHLLMPWKVALEINHVLRVGGLLFINTHPAWPLHDLPWDFWRFSDRAWTGLFNRYTGFEIISAVLGEEAMIVPRITHAVVARMDRSPTYLSTAVLCRKVAETSLTWPVPLREVAQGFYPAGELTRPPTPK